MWKQIPDALSFMLFLIIIVIAGLALYRDWTMRSERKRVAEEYNTQPIYDKRGTRIGSIIEEGGRRYLLDTDGGIVELSPGE